MGFPLKEQMRRGLVRQLDIAEYVTADEGTPVREVLYRMRVVDCSTTLVTREKILTGVFTERDVLRKVANRPETWDDPILELHDAPACGGAPGGQRPSGRGVDELRPLPRHSGGRCARPGSG